MKIKGFYLNSYIDEISQTLENLNNPFAFEKYCGACDNFNTENCPFLNKVSDITEWKLIKCNNFWD